MHESAVTLSSLETSLRVCLSIKRFFNYSYLLLVGGFCTESNIDIMTCYGNAVRMCSYLITS